MAAAVSTWYDRAQPGTATGDLVICRAAQTRRGWLFTYQTRSFVETRGSNQALLGNRPVLVDDLTGAVHGFSSAYGLVELARLLGEGSPTVNRWLSP